MKKKSGTQEELLCLHEAKMPRESSFGKSSPAASDIGGFFYSKA